MWSRVPGRDALTLHSMVTMSAVTLDTNNDSQALIGRLFFRLGCNPVVLQQFQTRSRLLCKRGRGHGSGPRQLVWGFSLKGLPLQPFSCARSCSHFIFKHSKDALVTTTCCGALIERVPTSSFRASRIGYAYSTHHCLTLVFTIFMPKGLFITPNHTHTHTHTRCNCHRYCDLGLGLYSVIQG